MAYSWDLPLDPPEMDDDDTESCQEDVDVDLLQDIEDSREFLKSYHANGGIYQWQQDVQLQRRI